MIEAIKVVAADNAPWQLYNPIAFQYLLQSVFTLAYVMKPLKAELKK